MGQYREKTCPHCGTIHRKKGPYCSRSCGNHRTYTVKQRKQKSEKQTAFLKSDNPVAEQSRWLISEVGRFNKMAKKDATLKDKGWEDYNVIEKLDSLPEIYSDSIKEETGDRRESWKVNDYGISDWILSHIVVDKFNNKDWDVKLRYTTDDGDKEYLDIK